MAKKSNPQCVYKPCTNDRVVGKFCSDECRIAYNKYVSAKRAEASKKTTTKIPQKFLVRGNISSSGKGSSFDGGAYYGD